MKAEITRGTHNRGIEDMRPTKIENRHYHKDGLRTQQMTRFRSNDGEDGEQSHYPARSSMRQRKLASREEPTFAVSEAM